MFCPSCATENSDLDVKFCRVCGKDLRLIAQAMRRSIGWKTMLTVKLDDFFMGPSQRRSREGSRSGLANILLGLSFLGLSIWNLLTHGISAFTGFMFFAAAFALVTGLGNVWVQRRRLNSDAYKEAERLPDDLSIYKRSHIRPANEPVIRPGQITREVSGNPKVPLAPPSVSEGTTVSLNKREKQPRERT